MIGVYFIVLIVSHLFSRVCHSQHADVLSLTPSHAIAKDFLNHMQKCKGVCLAFSRYQRFIDMQMIHLIAMITKIVFFCWLLKCQMNMLRFYYTIEYNLL